jgi:signal transduction histidine kinase
LVNVLPLTFYWNKNLFEDTIMPTFSRLILIFAILFLVLLISPAFLSQSFGPYPLMKTGDVTDILTPLILIPLYWLLFRLDKTPTVREMILFLVFAAAWVEGQGMHLSANSIGHLLQDAQDTNAYTLTHFYDEVLSHYLWHIGLAGLAALLIWRQVNNPLAVIKEKVGWIKDLLSEEDIQGSENYAEFEDAVRKIDYHVDRAKKVTHRLLGFARRMEPVQEKVDVNRVLDETVDFLRNEAHYRSITINTEYAKDLPQTMSDSSQLQQVFLNILNNAIDAVGKEGAIFITTQYRPGEKDIIVIIQDNGPGIPPEVLARIFDPFFTTKEVGAGTGLGLSISYSIMEKLGGRIMVASEIGQGTAFTIYLPVKEGYSV